MKENLKVEILIGKHSRPAPIGTRETFMELLRNSGFKKGEFKILLGKQIRGACEAKKIIIHNLNEQTGTIMIKAQINGKKDQRFETFLTLPYQFKKKPEAFLKALNKGQELINNLTDVIPSAKIIKKQIENQQESDKKNISKRTHRGIGFEHFIADEESIYLFWLEIKKFFQKDENLITITRKELIDNFLIKHGHFTSCYRFISKLIHLQILNEIKSSRRNKSDLIVGEKLQEIIFKVDDDSVKKKTSCTFAQKIDKLQLLVDNKKKIEALILEKEKLISRLKFELENLSKKITLEMQEAEKKLITLNKILD